VEGGESRSFWCHSVIEEEERERMEYLAPAISLKRGRGGGDAADSVEILSAFVPFT